MQKNLFLIVFLLLLIVVPFTGCKKALYNKLQGTWRYIDVTNLVLSTNYQEWEFKGDSLTISNFNSTGLTSYKISEEKTTFAIVYVKRHRYVSLNDTLESLKPHYQFQVVRLDSKALVFVDGTEGGLRIYEFEKIKK